MSFLPVQALSFTIAGSGVTSGATSITLTSLARIDGTLLTMTDFGTICYSTIEPGTNIEEQISFSSVTQNANGTATLGGVNWILDVSPYTSTSGTRYAHSGGSKMILSNTAGFYGKHFAILDNAQTFSGLNTFSTFPQKSGVTTPTLAAELATKAYVDATATGTTTVNGLVVSGTTNNGWTSGQILYYDTGSLTWEVADSSIPSKSLAVKLGVANTTVAALGTGNITIAGQATVINPGFVGIAYLGTGGGLLGTAPNPNTATIRVAGRMTAATTLLLEDDEQSPNVLTLVDNLVYAADSSGVANTVTLSISPTIVTVPPVGFSFVFKVANTNTTQVDLSLNGVNGRLKKLGGTSQLSGGDIVAGQMVTATWDGTSYQMTSPVANAPAQSKFGGTGSDGAFSVSSGVTVINFAGARVLENNYTSFDLTGTGQVTFLNPHPDGSTWIVNTTADANLTSATANQIDGRLMGGQATSVFGNPGGVGGAPGSFGFIAAFTSAYPGIGGGGGGSYASGTPGAATTNGVGNNTTFGFSYGGNATSPLNGAVLWAEPGGGGATGFGTNTVGAGGRGAAGIVFAVRGTYTATGSIALTGANGANATGGSNNGGGGGGGGGKMLVVANSIGTNTVTVSVNGGSGGSPTGSGTSAGAGGIGQYLAVLNTHFS